MLQEDGVAICHLEATGISFGYNNWSKTPPSSVQGTGDIIDNPLLAKTGPTGAGLLTAAYFKLLVNSPARDRAAVLGEVTSDFFGTPRGSAPDMGAIEFSSGVLPLTASATVSPTIGQAPLAVSFTGSASGGTSPYSYRWTFGDNTSSMSQNPSHMYSSAGTYTASLTVSDSQNAADSESLSIRATASSSALAAAATANPPSGPPPLTVNFTGSATGGSYPYSFSWTFGDGGLSTSQNPSHTYTAGGIYAATLTVTDSTSAKASAKATVTVGTVSATAGLALAVETGAPAPGQGGTTEPSPGNYTFSVGSTVSLKSVAYAGYRFSKWGGDVVRSGRFNPRTKLVMDNDKSLLATFCTKCSDVNGDLRITPADAQMAFDIYLKKTPDPTWCELENSDVNLSGTKLGPEVTPADALTIFERYLGKDSIDSTCSGSSRAAASSIQGVSLAGVKLSVNQSAFSQNGYFYVPVIIESPFKLAAFGFDLAFPSDQLDYAALERTELTSGFDQLDANVIPFPISNGQTVPGAVSPSGSPANPDGETGPANGPDQQPAHAPDGFFLRVGGYRSSATESPSSGVLITLVFRVTGQVNDPSSISIIATYDDIQNAAVIDATSEPNTTKTDRPTGKRAPERRPSRKRPDF